MGHGGLLRLLGLSVEIIAVVIVEVATAASRWVAATLRASLLAWESVGGSKFDLVVCSVKRVDAFSAFVRLT